MSRGLLDVVEEAIHPIRDAVTAAGLPWHTSPANDPHDPRGRALRPPSADEIADAVADEIARRGGQPTAKPRPAGRDKAGNPATIDMAAACMAYAYCVMETPDLSTRELARRVAVWAAERGVEVNPEQSTVRAVLQRALDLIRDAGGN